MYEIGCRRLNGGGEWGASLGPQLILGGAAYNLNACITNREGGNSEDPSEIIGSLSGVNQPAIRSNIYACIYQYSIFVYKQIMSICCFCMSL